MINTKLRFLRQNYLQINQSIYIKIILIQTRILHALEIHQWLQLKVFHVVSHNLAISSFIASSITCNLHCEPHLKPKLQKRPSSPQYVVHADDALRLVGLGVVDDGRLRLGPHIPASF